MKDAYTKTPEQVLSDLHSDGSGGLTKEQVDSIMVENDNDIEAAKGDLGQVKTELEQTKTQLQEANTTIDGFKDYDQVKSQVEEYKTKYEQSKAEYEAKIEEMQFGNSLEAAITAAGGRNSKAVKALLDIDTLKASKDQTADIKAAIEACQKDNSYLFGDDEPINNPVGPTGGAGAGGIDSNTAALRAAMGLPAETTK